MFTGLREFWSTDSRWEDLPDDGYLDGVFWHRHPDGQVRRTIVGGSEWIFPLGEEGDDWTLCSNNHSLAENQARYGEGVAFKRGKWTTKNEMTAAAQMVLDARWPGQRETREAEPCKGC